MIALAALLPCAAVVLGVLVFRLSGLAAAALALGVAVVLWLAGAFSALLIIHLGNGVVDALILVLLVGVVILAGLLFVEVSSRGGAFESIRSALDTMRLTPSRRAILITVGIGVALESLTGYGVSMLVTVPLLLGLLGRGQAIALAFVGMSLMTWGALSVAAMLGAELAGLPLGVLAEEILLTSGPVAFVLPALCVALVPNSEAREWGFAIAAGAALVFGIVVTTYLIGIEVAGVGGGLAVISLCVAAGQPSRRLLAAVTAKPLWPYALLVAVVIVQKLVAARLSDYGFAPTISSGRVSFVVLTSPAIALLGASLVSLVLFRSALTDSIAVLSRHVLQRAWRALASIFLFLLTARLLVEIGAIAALAKGLSQLGIHAAIGTVTFLGGLGAYVTGSGVTANALFMPSAATTGESLGAVPLFAALQHSAGSHAAIASLPVIAILLAALPQRGATDERDAMKTALGLASLWLVMVAGSGWVQVALSSR